MTSRSTCDHRQRTSSVTTEDVDVPCDHNSPGNLWGTVTTPQDSKDCDHRRDPNEITIPLGPTWKGFEFIKIRKYRRKPGYRITFVRRYWSGKYRTLATETALTADEIVRKINELLLPIFRLPEEEVERIRRFCWEG